MTINHRLNECEIEVVEQKQTIDWLRKEVERLSEIQRWYDCHHAKCEDIHGAECVPSEEEVERYHKTGDWEGEE